MEYSFVANFAIMELFSKSKRLWYKNLPLEYTSKATAIITVHNVYLLISYSFFLKIQYKLLIWLLTWFRDLIYMV